MKLYVPIVLLSSLLFACGGHGSKQEENSSLGSVGIKTSIPKNLQAKLSKVEVITRAADGKEQIYPFSSLTQTVADIFIPAGEYTFSVKLYQKANDQDELYAQSLPEHAECPDVKASIKGGMKTDININVCAVDTTRPLESGLGSGLVNVNIRGFQKFLTCEVKSTAYQSLGIDVRLSPENKAEAFRVVLGRLDSDGKVQLYAAALMADSSLQNPGSFNARFKVLNQAGEQAGTFLAQAGLSGIFAYDLTLKDGTVLKLDYNGIGHCTYASTIIPPDLRSFLNGN